MHDEHTLEKKESWTEQKDQICDIPGAVVKLNSQTSNVMNYSSSSYPMYLKQTFSRMKSKNMTIKDFGFPD